MGNYNPHAPYVIGDEWVPIRQADFAPDDAHERGYMLYLDQGTVIVSGSNSIAQVTPTASLNKVFLNAVYPAGTEDMTGPIRQVVIPVDSVTTTGASVGATVNDFITPSDNNDAFIIADTPGQGIGLSFNVAGFTDELSGKRILNVELLYVAYGDPLDMASVRVDIGRAAFASPVANQTFTYQTGLEGPPLGQVATTEVNSVPFYDVNPFWNAAYTPSTSRERFPWRYQELALLDASATPSSAKLQVSILWNSVTDSFDPVFIKYAALRVTYCEERRVLYGARDVIALENVPGVWLHRMLDTSFQNGATTLPAGPYTVTTTFRSLTTSSTGAVVAVDSISAPTIDALRQLYELPTLPGVIVNQSLTVDDTFTKESTDILPHTLLFTAGSTVTGSHAYGRQLGAPVYGSNTASQEVNGTANGGGFPLQRVRFYARRFGPSSGILRVRNAGNTIFADISSEEFDALDEIVDGWRQVTLTLNQAITPGAAEVISWQAASAGASNQWQILGANGQSLASGGAFSSGFASYAPPNGATLDLSWKQPNTASPFTDSNAEATVLLSATPLAVTGFASFACEIAVTGVGANCPGVNPACIPTAIHGNGLSWDVGTVIDHFDRTVVSDWGDATTGQNYDLFGSGSPVVANWNVADGVGTVTVPTANASRVAYLPSYSRRDVDVTVSFRVPVSVISGGAIEPAHILLRGTSISSYYLARVTANTVGAFQTGSFTLRLYNPAGTVLAVVTLPDVVHQPDVWFRFRARAAGSDLRAKLWRADDDEPSGWQIQAQDSTALTAGWVGVGAGIAASNTNAPITFEFTDLCVVPAEIAGGAIEIQRSDEFDDFQTIYRSSPCALPEFCDYEARVGVESTYRIRTVNELDFEGEWSAELPVTLAAPGVGGIASNRPGVLIFTSNHDPASSLAYVEVFDRNLTEPFTFPESSFQDLRTQYGRDYFVAFRPTERGGEQFSRTLLVNAAAIPLPSLGNFRSLRDLAWAALPYVCVRDELGNRWLANVLVPGGNVRRNRRLYLAEVTISEVTDTPAPVT